jgi:hypothetical protein
MRPSEPEWLAKARAEGRITETRTNMAALDIDRIHQRPNDTTPIRFDLPIPPSTNNLYVNTRRGRVLSPEGRAWKESVLLELALKKMRPWVASVAKPFGIEYTVVGPVNMSRDIANFEKICTDCLVTAGVIPGDSIRAGLWRMCLMYVHAAEGMPHVKVEIHSV